MDKDREIRFLIPPFFLLAALLWGAYLTGQLYPYLHGTIQDKDAETLKFAVSILGILSIATFPVGYAIGVITIRFLELPFIRPMFSPHNRFDMPISEAGLSRIWVHFCVPRKHGLSFVASSAFDHAIVKPEIHAWQVRRWTAFNISSQCATALVLSIPFALVFHIQVLKWTVWTWWASIALLTWLFIWNSVRIWRECREMFEFSAEVPMVLRP